MTAMTRKGEPAAITERGNVTGAAPLSKLPPGLSWQVFDELPRAIRRALHEANLNWCSGSVAIGYERAIERFGWQDANHVMVARIRAIDADERRRFADDYEARFSTPYPARAARSTLTRYGRRRT